MSQMIKGTFDWRRFMEQKHKSAEQKLTELISTAINILKGMETQLYGGEERPNDLMDCGCIDGAYNTWIDVLNLLGVEHSFEAQPM